jgi:hypothetical protein
VRGKHHQRSDDEGSNTADPSAPKSADMSLRHHEDDAEKHQRSAGIVDRHEGQRVEQLETLYLCIAGRGCDDPGAAHLCELKGKKRDPARSLRQHRLTRLHVAKLNDRAPGR